ncbi:MAG: tyrosine-type recombinase/integrase [Paludibacteraceae bacterium]|nr:tyrosine-type recombinase/integrase [Paludibacteraceae bacterium]
MPSTLTIQQTSANFVPADLRHDTNGWYIVYYAFNPIISKLEMKRIKLNLLKKRCRSMVEFKVQVNDIMRTIDNQLRTAALNCVQTTAATPATIVPEVATVAASTPVVAPLSTPSAPVSENVRYYKTLDEVTRIFTAEKEKELRNSTMRSYKSFCHMLREWANEHYPYIKMSMFERAHAVEFLDDMAAKGLGPNTYNNMIRLGSVLFIWAKAKCYTRENPFDGQKRKRVLEKTRTIIKPEHQALIDKWFADNQPEMRIVCRLIYTSLLRPIEITRVQVKQIDFVNHCIRMPREKTKTWEAREGRLDAELEEMLRKHIQGANPDDYLFADSLWRCGKRPMGNGTYGKAWDRMRTDLKLPKEYQLYSLKDTAINSMLKAGVDDLSVMQAAGHKDLSMTTIYANHHDDKLIDNLNQKAPKFAIC